MGPVLNCRCVVRRAVAAKIETIEKERMVATASNVAAVGGMETL